MPWSKCFLLQWRRFHSDLVNSFCFTLNLGPEKNDWNNGNRMTSVEKKRWRRRRNQGYILYAANNGKMKSLCLDCRIKVIFNDSPITEVVISFTRNKPSLKYSLLVKPSVAMEKWSKAPDWEPRPKFVGSVPSYGRNFSTQIVKKWITRPKISSPFFGNSDETSIFLETTSVLEYFYQCE